VEPELGIVEEVAGGQCDALWLRCAPNMEIVFTFVQPGKRIVGVVELRKLQLVRRGHNVVGGPVIVVSVSAATTVLLSVMRQIAWRRGPC
jgi:hypothetical protein